MYPPGNRGRFGAQILLAHVALAVALILSGPGSVAGRAEAQPAARADSRIVLFNKTPDYQDNFDPARYRGYIDIIVRRVRQLLRTHITQYIDVERQLVGPEEYAARYPLTYYLEMKFYVGEPGIALDLLFMKVRPALGPGAEFGILLKDWQFGFPWDPLANEFTQSINKFGWVVPPYIRYENRAGEGGERFLANCIWANDLDDSVLIDLSQKLTSGYGHHLLKSEMERNYAIKNIDRREWQYVCSSKGIGDHPGQDGFTHWVSGFIQADRKTIELQWQTLGENLPLPELVHLVNAVDAATLANAAAMVADKVANMAASAQTQTDDSPDAHATQ